MVTELTALSVPEKARSIFFFDLKSRFLRSDTASMDLHRDSTSNLETPRLSLLTDYRGALTRIRVEREGRITEYERTNRRASSIFDGKTGELGGFFQSPRDFANALGPVRLLDLGCGGGGFVRDLRNLGFRATGLDLHLEDSCLKNPAFVRGDAYSPPFEPGSFDCITSVFSVFHYEPLRDLPHLTSMALRLLAPGGRLLLNGLTRSGSEEVVVRQAQLLGAKVFRSTSDGGLQILVP